MNKIKMRSIAFCKMAETQSEYHSAIFKNVQRTIEYNEKQMNIGEYEGF